MSTEEIINPAAQTKGRARQEVSVIIQDELQIAGVTEESFTALKAEVAALPPDADIASLQKLITKGNRLISTISDAIEPGKKWAHALHKAYTSNENEFIGTVKAIIDPLKEKKAAYQAEQERIEREQNEAREARIRERLVAIEGYEFVRKTGSQGEDDYYMNAGGTRLPMTQVTMSGDEEWGNIIKGIEFAWNEEKERKEAAEAAEQEERFRILAQREEFERREREMKEREDRINGAVNVIRKNELFTLGVSEDCYYKQHFLGESVQAPFHEYTDTEWPLVLERVKEVVGRIQEKERAQQVAAEREALIAERVKALKDAGWAMLDNSLVVASNSPIPPEMFDASVMSEERFNALLEEGRAIADRKKKVEQDRIAAEAVEAERKRQEEEATRKAAEEQERKAKLSDVERWDAWMVAIEENAPTLVSAQGQHAVSHLLAYINSLGSEFRNSQGL